MADFELQRKNMVESQVRPSDITDRRIMRAMLALPREMFAAEHSRALAYMDQELPVGSRSMGGSRRALVSPRVLSRLLQLAEIEAGDRVLEIGTATGYGAAIMARMARKVVALDSDEGLAALARKAMSELSVENVDVVTGPHAAGWKGDAPYAAIVLGGAVPEVSAGLLDQLQDGGRLAAVVGTGGIGQVMQWRRIGSTFASRCVAEAGAPPLPGFERVPGFAF